MSEPARFLTSFVQALSTMVLYREGHPARERSIDQAYTRLKDLQDVNPRPLFSFLGHDTIYGQLALRELKEWDWAARLSNAGVQRLEFDPGVPRDEFVEFLEEVMARITLSVIDTAGARTGRRSSIKFGAIGVRGEEGMVKPVQDNVLPTATIAYTLNEEADTVRWMHDEVASRGKLPLIEAETVVRSLSVAMHGDSQIIIPLVQMKEFDEYTTTHSLNVSVLSMALAEFMGLAPRDVRAFGVAGLLHDLGKVRVPKDILNKPGKLTDAEFDEIKKHPVEGAKIIVESDRDLDVAAVVAYEHHMMLNGGGYPKYKIARDAHRASRFVHVCDVYDALRTNRPYREAWEADRVLAHIQKGSGPDFDPEVVNAFSAMMAKWERRLAVVDDQEAIKMKGTPAQGVPVIPSPGQVPAPAPASPPTVATGAQA